VLTNSHGFTLYWFAIDTPTKSNCNGSCATYWPPVTGTPSMASGVSLTGHFGTIKRSDGSTQATYDGHPLYTYKGDTAAGQTGGNGLNLSGGLWYAMTPTGAKPAAAKTSSPSSGGGGY
jgi:predicted lipoprotein with Yx(FWY)xxD motif